jgi:C1A family cysteine protease
MKTKYIIVTVLALLAVMYFSLSGAAATSSQTGNPASQELLVTELDNGSAVNVNGEVLVLNLESNPSTGYGWQVQGLNARVLRQLQPSEWLPDSQGKLGGWGTEVLRFAAVGQGHSSLNLIYARPWETTAPANTFSMEVMVTELSKDVNYPRPVVDDLLGTSREEGTLGTLPSAYNWCSQGVCTPVRDQGNCGSCWAFGTVGSLESAILIQNSVSRDLAEQYLVSCNMDGWGCDGGWWAHDYHEWKYPPSEPGPGAVYEADFPYTATDAPCNGPYTHHETIADWVYIAGENSVPSTDAIKQAILDHGPVSAAVCVNSAFQSYTGGVFNPFWPCFSINHAIVLVGWDDSLGAWRLRNSWGLEWGEDGYMWIAYGKSYVGYSANYVVYTGSTTPPAAPTNLAAAAVSYSQINLTWTDNSVNETQFMIERCTGNGCSDFTQIDTVTANVTSYLNTGLTASTSYSYRVRASNGAGDSDYTNTSSAATLESPTPPAAPTNLAATTVSSSQINLTWIDTDNIETGFKIERCTGADCTNFAQIATVGANVTSYANTGLSAATTYSYRVQAYNEGGNSGYSNIASAVTQAAAVVPTAPSNLVATAVSKSQINLTWTDNASNETGFKIERCKGSICTNFKQIATVGANITSYSSTGLSSNTTYRFRVRAYNASGDSTYSNIAAATTPRR